MAEYIEREALIADIEKRYCRPCEVEGKDYNHVRCRACWVDDMVGEIESAAAAEVVPAPSYLVPSKEEWMERFCTPKQMAGFKKRKGENNG